MDTKCYICNRAAECRHTTCRHRKVHRDKTPVCLEGPCAQLARQGIDDIRAECIEIQPCGHPLSAVAGVGPTHWCRLCADDEAADIEAGLSWAGALE